MWAEPAASTKTRGVFPLDGSTTGGGGLAGTKCFGNLAGFNPGDL